MVIHEIMLRRPDEIRPFKTNARTHPAKQVDAIAGSIARFGFTNPILVDEDSEIIAGHGRLLAARKLGLELVPTLLVAGLSDVEKRALRLADNKIALQSGWDRDLLKFELAAIEIETPELLGITGFEMPEIDLILSSGAEDPDDEVALAIPAAPVVSLGDVWLAGPHRVGCGDAKDLDLVRRVVAIPAAAAFQDPPYNVPVQGHVSGLGRVKHKEFAEASGEMTEEAFVAFLTRVLGNAAAVSRPGAVHFTCMDHHHLDQLFEAARAVYERRLNLCVWKKSNAGMGSLYRSHHELVAVHRVAGAPHVNNVQLGRHGRNRTNVWEYASVNTFDSSRQADLLLHPTVKPTGMVADAILDVTRRGEVVTDLFLGSGTTLIACERTGRHFAGVEIDPGYVEVGLTRWRDMTGDEPVLERTGQTLADLQASILEAAE
ncbi:MAG: site-specific DNA-methyltransferase [Brevundimonas sp.]|jgi:hypothetical protein|uniref:site-specific DNA-methyltransferase n=1 Tax=Brevundimonas sp. TaxID=1871086 RepID=UPI00391A28FA